MTARMCFWRVPGLPPTVGRLLQVQSASRRAEGSCLGGLSHSHTRSAVLRVAIVRSDRNGETWFVTKPFTNRG
jgi:hypothetical protein